MDGTGILFEPFLRVLPPAVRPVVVSYPPDLPLGYDDLLPIVLDALPRGPFVLVGESFSGPLALRAAAAGPAGLVGVVLVATFLTSPIPRFVRPFLVAPLFDLAPYRLELTLLAGLDASPEIARLLRQARAKVPGAVLTERVRAILGVDATDALRECAAPLLYLRGMRDRLVGRSSLRAIRRARLDVESVSLDAPHLLLQTRPEEAWEAILSTTAFSASCPRSS